MKRKICERLLFNRYNTSVHNLYVNNDRLLMQEQDQVVLY